MKLHDIVQQYLDLVEWRDSIRIADDGEASSMGTQLVLHDQTCRLYVDTDERRTMILVYLYAPFRVREAKRTEAVELINALHRRFPIGRLEMDPADGELRYRHSVDVEHVQPTAEFVGDMVSGAAAIFDRYLPALAEVAFTERSAREILDTLDTDATRPRTGADDTTDTSGSDQAFDLLPEEL